MFVIYVYMYDHQFSSVHFIRWVISDSLWPHEPQHARPPYPSPTPKSTQTHVHWVSDAIQPLIFCHPLVLLPSVFPSIRVFSNESALCIRWPKYWTFSFNISPSNEHPGLISFRMGLTSLLSEGLARVFSDTTVQKHQFFGTQLSSQSSSHIHTWPLEKPSS